MSTMIMPDYGKLYEIGRFFAEQLALSVLHVIVY